MPIEQLLRDEWGRLLALLVARTRRLDLAEDALAEAFEAAVRTWPRDGIPERPQAWLFTTAQRRIVDRLRAEAVAARKQPVLTVEETHRMQDNGADSDDLLRLVLLAAHPALAPESGAALTLRLVMGVSTADIARLFLVSESTMAARLTRARKKVIAAGIPFALPEASMLTERLEVVAQVAYLAFTAGYAPGTGPDVLRAELSGEAIRLVRLVLSQVPGGHPTLAALLALMLLQHSRRDARVDGNALVLLPDQDRALWRAPEIAEGLGLLDALTTGGGVIGVESELTASYLLQALIAAEHAQAARAEQTRWDRIADLYGQLDALTQSPIVRMNRAVAVAEAGAADAAWAMVADLDGALGNSHRLAAVRADIAMRRGDPALAYDEFGRAIASCDNEPERAQLRHRQEYAQLARDGAATARKPDE